MLEQASIVQISQHLVASLQKIARSEPPEKDVKSVQKYTKYRDCSEMHDLRSHPSILGNPVA